jgi:putative DNA primase/helicase
MLARIDSSSVGVVVRTAKSTVNDAVMDIFGPSYSWKMAFDSLLQKKDHGIPRDIADLEGRRFVTAVESKEGAKFDSARLKDLTGGEKRHGRRLFKEATNFDPTDKIWLATNYLPDMSDTSDGAWRRVRLIPFLAKFDADDPKCDKNLPDKLRAEYPGILAWMVRGGLGWQVKDLGMPSSVT